MVALPRHLAHLPRTKVIGSPQHGQGASGSTPMGASASQALHESRRMRRSFRSGQLSIRRLPSVSALSKRPLSRSFKPSRSPVAICNSHCSRCYNRCKNAYVRNTRMLRGCWSIGLPNHVVVAIGNDQPVFVARLTCAPADQAIDGKTPTDSQAVDDARGLYPGVFTKYDYGRFKTAIIRGTHIVTGVRSGSIPWNG